MEEEKHTKAAIYMRVSTEDQAREGFSLAAQLDKLQSYCKVRDWIVAGSYTDDGYSGRNIRRPAYTQMMDEMDQWDTILVIKMDRIHRNSKNFMVMMENLKKQEKEFVSITESLDTSTAMGRFVMDIIQRIAQLESEQIGERVYIGMEQKAKTKDKGPVGHEYPFGYKWDKDKKTLIEVQKELEIVRKIYDLYIKGDTITQIHKKTKVPRTTVHYILHNCFYAGVERWCKFFKKLDIEPCISIDTFNEVQKLIRQRCPNMKKYKPMILKKEDTFQYSDEECKKLPGVNRAKHRFTY